MNRILPLLVLQLAAMSGEPAAGAIVESRSAGSSAGARRRAVLVAVNEYATIQPLLYCGRDMQALHQRLLSAGFQASDVLLLCDRAESARGRPLKANIERELQSAIENSKEEDTLVLAFSGHGVHLGGTSYLCPSEARLADPGATMISLEWIYAKLENCRARQRLMLVDACRNDPEIRGERSLRKSPTSVEGFARALLRPPEGLLVLASCQPGQVSVEDERLRHGVFMYHILKGLEGEADRDGGNADGKISLLELYGYASVKTKTHVARTRNLVQTPSLRGEISGDFDLLDAMPPTTDRLPSRFYRDSTPGLGVQWRLAADPDVLVARSPEALAALRQAHSLLFRNWVSSSSVNAGPEACRQAIAACRDALQREPGNAFAYLLRGMAHRACGNFAAALADWQKIDLALDVKLAIPYEVRRSSKDGHPLRTEDRVTGSVEDSDEVVIDAVEGDWAHVASVKQRAGTRRADGQGVQNHGWIEKRLLKVEADEEAPLSRRSFYLWMLLDDDRSGTWIRAERPETVAALRRAQGILRGDEKLSLEAVRRDVPEEQCNRAILACNEALRWEPANGGAFALRGLAYRKKRDFARALDDFQKLAMPLLVEPRAEKTVELHTENRATGSVEPRDTLQVTRVEGDWLWVESVERWSSDKRKSPARGWIESSQVK